MIGIVTGIKISPNQRENIYTVVGEKDYEIESTKSALVLELLDRVEIKEDASTVILGNVTKREYSSLVDKMIKKRFTLSAPSPVSVKELDSVTTSMKKILKEAAMRFMRSCMTGCPIIVRFHNDCDGASGALALYYVVEQLKDELGISDINISYRMNKSVGYTHDSFHIDQAFFNTYSSCEKPLVFISDFGTSEESEASITSAKGKIEFIWLDHHPIYEKFPKKEIGLYINPWDFDGDSDYTAGLLCCTFSECLYKYDTKHLKQASMIGDFSRHANRDDQHAMKISVILDYMTSKTGGENLTPKQIDSVIGNKESFDETYLRASGMMSEAIELGLKNVKKYKTRNGLNIFVLDFKSISALNMEYPLPGRYSSRLQERMELLNGPKTMTLVHYGNYISMRAGRDVLKEIKPLKIIETIKEDCDYIYSFGGHEQAASVRSDKEHIGEVVKLMLTAFGC